MRRRSRYLPTWAFAGVDGAHKRRLAGTARPDDAEHLAFQDGQAHVVDGRGGGSPVSGKLDLDVLQLYHGTTFLCDDCLVRAGLAEAGEDVVGVVDDAFERIGLHDSFHSLGEFGVGIGACTAMTL